MGRNIKIRVCPICKRKFILKSLLSPLKVFSKNLSGDKNPTYFCSIKCYESFMQKDGRYGK